MKKDMENLKGINNGQYNLFNNFRSLYFTMDKRFEEVRLWKYLSIKLGN